MSPHVDRGDLPAELPDHQAAELLQVAQRLERERPTPASLFRGNLGRHLRSSAGQRVSARRLRVLVAIHAAAGCLLLGLPAVGVLGAGPFEAEGRAPQTITAQDHETNSTRLCRNL